MRHILLQGDLIWHALQERNTSDFDVLWDLLRSRHVQGYITIDDLTRLYCRIAQEQDSQHATQLIKQFQRVLIIYSAEDGDVLDVAIANQPSQSPCNSDLPVLSISSFLERYALDQLYESDLQTLKPENWYRKWRTSKSDPFLLVPIAFTLAIQHIQFLQTLLSDILDTEQHHTHQPGYAIVAANNPLLTQPEFQPRPSAHDLPPSGQLTAKAQFPILTGRRVSRADSSGNGRALFSEHELTDSGTREKPLDMVFHQMTMLAQQNSSERSLSIQSTVAKISQPATILNVVAIAVSSVPPPGPPLREQPTHRNGSEAGIESISPKQMIFNADNLSQSIHILLCSFQGDGKALPVASSTAGKFPTVALLVHLSKNSVQADRTTEVNQLVVELNATDDVIDVIDAVIGEGIVIDALARSDPENDGNTPPVQPETTFLMTALSSTIIDAMLARDELTEGGSLSNFDSVSIAPNVVQTDCQVSLLWTDDRIEGKWVVERSPHNKIQNGQTERWSPSLLVNIEMPKIGDTQFSITGILVVPDICGL